MSGSFDASPREWMTHLRDGANVLIVGGYGVRNVGDEAILEGLLRQLPAGVRPTVISRDPADTRRLHAVQSVSARGALFELLRSDMVIVGGGGLFSSDTGPLGRYIPTFCRVAHNLHKPVAFHGVGIYASTSPALLRSIANLTPRVVTFTVRDAVSVTTLEAAGVHSRLVGDLSHSMLEGPSTEADRLMDKLGLRSDQPTVGLSLTAINGRLETFVLEAMPGLIEAMPGVQFCFVPMSQHPTNERHNDLLFARRLRELSPRLTVLDAWEHPASYLALFRRFDVAICSRFHSFLFADRTGTPIVPLPYSEKCFGWLEEHGMGGISLTPEALIASVRQAIELSEVKRAEAVA